jgi:hypothetical protein
MITCTHPQCGYNQNPDEATHCAYCKRPLNSASEPRRGDTLTEESQFRATPRRQTMAEGMDPVTPSLPVGDSQFRAAPRRQTMADGVIPAAPVTPVTPMVASLPQTLEPVVPTSRWSDSGPTDLNQRRRTVYAGEAAPAPAAPFSTPYDAPAVSTTGGRRATAQEEPGRKIVGVLITYSWQEQGQIFPVLAGRNLIGRDPAQCDIAVPQDATLSSVNSSISYRRQFVIVDKDSMSGTYVDGEPVETEPVMLRNYARIRTGSTYWTFVSIQPPDPPVTV